MNAVFAMQFCAANASLIYFLWFIVCSSADCPMVISDMPFIILILASGYLMTVYLLLIVAQRLMRMPRISSQKLHRSTDVS